MIADIEPVPAVRVTLHKADRSCTSHNVDNASNNARLLNSGRRLGVSREMKLDSDSESAITNVVETLLLRRRKKKG